MAYKSYTPDGTVEVMGQSYKKFAKDLADMKKAKGDKKKIKDLEKELKVKGDKLKKLLEKESNGITKNFNAHALNIEKWLGQGVLAVKDAKAALKRFEKKPSVTKELGTAEIALPRLQALAKQANDDADAYGKSWFKWREWNGQAAFNLDKSVVDAFFKARRKLMADQKNLGSKIDKIEALVKEAASVKKEAQTLGLKTAKGLSQLRTEMAILRTDLAKDGKRIGTEKGKSLSVFEQNCRTLANNAKNKDVSADLANLCKDVWTNAVACVKFAREIHKSLDTRLKSQLKTMDKAALADSEIKKELKTCMAIVDKAKTDKTTAENALKNAATHNAAIQKNAKK